MEIFRVILVILTIIGCVSLLLYLVLKIRATINAERILKYGKQSDHFVYDLMCTTYRKKYIFRNVYFPDDRYGDRTVETDIIFVCKGGICVIEVKGIKGFIENPIKGDWNQFYNNNVFMFQNPFEQNVSHIKAVKNILIREELPNIPVHNIVVFTDKRVKFKFREDMLLKADKLLPFLHDLNKNRFVSRQEITNVVKIIRKYQVKGYNTRRNNINNGG